MAGVHLIALVAAVVTIAALVEMLRRRQIRQKYAITWVLVGVAVAVVAVDPGLFNGLAHALGVINPPDLLAVMAALFLLLVTVHLSWEIGRLEDRSRLLAEEVALLRADLEERDARDRTGRRSTDGSGYADGVVAVASGEGRPTVA
ncbi:DUF2304 domain-containing protein [Acidiferrimicrobium sp. IK]|uniref:DUF2304 domain-containing protein n=1 Tax=Acidiferrimicrobium sp. IK TaxID=2871700 RepID=UPI0021CB942B|nr:DUF2304 domain-containing protein [Acidiferrimicrobium sp. IK]MCU4182924.1 DUF2304 domain-containing protein [Acidiferrimicrobium sp. IK]